MGNAQCNSKKVLSVTELDAWKDLLKHHQSISNTSIPELFYNDPGRFETFHKSLEGLTLDYSKQRITTQTIEKLCTLARACDLENWRDQMFEGVHVNTTENRAVLHTALRNKDLKSLEVEDKDIVPEIKAAYKKMENFTTKIRAEGKFSRVVNIGIGGSDLGPHMVAEALKPFSDPNIKVHYVSNVDSSHLLETFKTINPAKTLFIITSKTFTTQETMCNAHTARKLMQKALGKDDVGEHFVAATQNIEEAEKFGITEEHIFPIWDWVGGRYSLWSAIGLSFCIAIGFDNFQKLLDGAYTMDKHFRNAPLEENIPVLLALIGIWNRNFEGSESLGIIPYDQYLYFLPSHMQQLDMESNGKSVTRYGTPITDYKTGPIVLGQTGTDAQHAFFQSVHQGTEIIPCDFIFSLKSQKPAAGHHYKLLANAIAQSKALMEGQSHDNPHKVFSGSRPSNTIVIEELDPYNLGLLMVMYEHKIFVQGIIWNINSFDQHGVELGKVIANQILHDLGDNDCKNAEPSKMDSSTAALIEMIKKTR
ncbi:MAG: glucose-6-phosphate isomerase [Alphaproteobacteria bacterium]|nr:glucose-6-phosphate isomerase [Alphaproteobacteria bacterium]